MEPQAYAKKVLEILENEYHKAKPFRTDAEKLVRLTQLEGRICQLLQFCIAHELPDFKEKVLNLYEIVSADVSGNYNVSVRIS